MDLDPPEEHRMLAELAQRFVRDALLPLERQVLAREAAGQGAILTPEERTRIDTLARDIGLWGLDAPVELGGAGLPLVATVAVNEALGATVTPYLLPPDSPNLRMLMATVNEDQRRAYLEPYVAGQKSSAIAISEPGAGSDLNAMLTRAERRGNDWVINGRKIWVSNAADADFTIVMAATGQATEKRRAISAFLVDRDTPGFNVTRCIPMLGGAFTYELALEDCRVSHGQLLGDEGRGFAPMQLRLGIRRVQIASWCVGAAQRALDMLCEHALLRKTFGVPLADRQAVQWWVADAASRIHACRLMCYDCAWKIDRGRDARIEISMIKLFATEMASDVIDHAMQAFGAMGMAKEMPLHLLAAKVRNMRIYDGPSEVHRWVIARSRLAHR